MLGETLSTLRRRIGRVLVFTATFFIVVLLMAFLPSTNVFWHLLEPRFAQDERYQLQTLFLPKKAKQLPLVVVGDSLFHNSLPSTIRDITGARKLVINGYDADDASKIIRGLRVGTRFAKTRVCSILLQVSPVFSVRAKAFHVAQKYRLISLLKPTYAIDKSVRNFFDALESWATTNQDGDPLSSDPQRPPRLVGQARFADPNAENWNGAFADVPKFKGRIVAVLDTRGTDWGSNSNVVAETEKGLEALAAANTNLSWTRLETLNPNILQECRQ